MRLLDRYLLREFMIPLPYCLAGFLLFWISSDLITELDAFRQDRLGVLDVGEYYLMKLPDFLVLLLPVVLLLSLLYAMTNHARHQEFTAMKAAGRSLWRICLPYFGVGLFFSLAVYVLNEQLAPAGKERAEQVRKRHVRGDGLEEGRWRLDLKFRNDRENRFWRIRALDLVTGDMQEPYVEWTRPDGSRRQLLAQRGVHTNGSWLFLDGRLFDPDPNSATPIEAFESLTVPEITETPEMIRSHYRVSQLSSVRAARKVQLTVAEIVHYRFLHPDLRPKERALLDTQLYARLAQPWTCLVVVLIAVPFGAASGRRNVFVGVASSIFICFLYFVVQQLGMGLGTGQRMPPLLAAWLPNGLFGLAGVLLTLRAR